MHEHSDNTPRHRCQMQTECPTIQVNALLTPISLNSSDTAALHRKNAFHIAFAVRKSITEFTVRLHECRPPHHRATSPIKFIIMYALFLHSHHSVAYHISNNSFEWWRLQRIDEDVPTAPVLIDESSSYSIFSTYGSILVCRSLRLVEQDYLHLARLVSSSWCFESFGRKVGVELTIYYQVLVSSAENQFSSTHILWIYRNFTRYEMNIEQIAYI